MKILILSDGNNPHTIKWIEAMAKDEFIIHLISLSDFDSQCYPSLPNLTFESMKIPKKLVENVDGYYSKILYLKTIGRIKKRLREIKPDILHSHYASSYGLLGRLTNFHPHIVSVWGSDVYNFPRNSFIHKLIFQYILSGADAVLSTSFVMAVEINKYTNKKIDVTPFGIDTEKFKPKKIDMPFNRDHLVIGTIKSLETHYGIEYLIRAFAILRSKISNKKIKLLIVGKGSREKYLKKLTVELCIENDVHFTGFVDYKNISDYHNALDIAVYTSINESFGVSVLESCACEKPVIVSDCPGFKEVVTDGQTGLIVPSMNTSALASALEKLLLNDELMISLGKNGRKRVEKYYDLKKSVEKMINIYKRFL